MKLKLNAIRLTPDLVSSKHNVSVLVLVTCVTTLMGCQTTHPNQLDNTVSQNNKIAEPIVTSLEHHQQLTMTNKSFQDQFSDKPGLKVDEQAQQMLLTAFKKHLTSDHVSVTKTRTHDAPFIAEDSVDAGSETVLKALLIALDEYYNRRPSDLYSDDYAMDDSSNYDSDGNISYGPAYRTEEDYLDIGNLSINQNHSQQLKPLYFNYGDEKKGTLPFAGYNIDRQTGLSIDYITGTEDVIHYSDGIYECVTDFSTHLDDLVTEDPLITSQSNEVKALKTSYQQCLKQNNDANASVIKTAKGYQVKYIERQKGCAGRFDKQIVDILDPNRKPKAINYDSYDTVYKGYSACDWNIILLNETEPYYYLDEGWPEYIIKYKQDIIDCTDKMINQQQQAVSKGITYKNDPETYVDIYNKNEECAYEAKEEKLDAESDAYSIEQLTSITNEEDSNDAESESVGADEEADEDESKDESEKSEFLKTIDKLFNMYHRTPSQIEASNFYQNQNLTFSHISEFNSRAKQLNTIYSYDFVTPTSFYSIQLPVSLDFGKDTITLDPSAVLPIMALISPENTPLPEELDTTMVAFHLPEEISSKIPASVIYDAFIDAVGYSMSELDSSYFTALDIHNDNYAKSLGASSAVKVNFDSKQTGKVIGVTVKHMARALESYIKSHPDKFDDVNLVQVALKKWQENNTKFQSEDVGTLFQLIEAIMPISFNKTNYFYLDSQGQLLGTQTQTTIGGDILGAKSTILSQTSFNKNSFKTDPLYSKFQQSFGVPFKDDMPASTDGNAWIDKIKQREEKLNKATFARYKYRNQNADLCEVESEYGDAFDNDYHESYCEDEGEGEDNYIDISKEMSSDEATASDDYESAIRILNSGSVNEEADQVIENDDQF